MNTKILKLKRIILAIYKTDFRLINISIIHYLDQCTEQKKICLFELQLFKTRFGVYFIYKKGKG